MCYRTRLKATKEQIQATFHALFNEEGYEPNEEINGFSFSATPVITNEDRNKIQLYNWGLIPFWAKDDKIKKATLNARIETAAEKPSYRNAVVNRCLVIADGYYEWEWLDAKGKEKQKYFIKPKEQEIFAFAGIYSKWKNPNSNNEIETYSIITTDANELMAKIHNNKKRMPVVLEKDDWQRYLLGEELKNFALPYSVDLEAVEV